MRVLWSAEALDDRRAISDYISEVDPDAAQRVDAEFSDAVARLAVYPQLGKPGIVRGTREVFPISSYRLVYEVKDTELWILALVHTARLWPRTPER